MMSTRVTAKAEKSCESKAYLRIGRLGLMKHVLGLATLRRIVEAMTMTFNSREVRKIRELGKTKNKGTARLSIVVQNTLDLSVM